MVERKWKKNLVKMQGKIEIRIKNALSESISQFLFVRPVLLALTSQMGAVIRNDLCSRYFRFVNRKGFVVGK